MSSNSEKYLSSIEAVQEIKITKKEEKNSKIMYYAGFFSE
jgi:hypothetical protein